MTCLTCPNCGFDLQKVDNLQLGELTIIRGAEVRWKGKPVTLTMSQTLIVGALARAAGAWVDRIALAEACGYDRDGDLSQLIDVHICRIRKAFRAVDPAFAQIKRQMQWHGSGATRWQA